MPRVYKVERAAKDNSAVKRGEPYYWWKFRYGGKQMSATYPRPSQLTQSKVSQVLGAKEDLEDQLAELRGSEPDEFDAQGFFDPLVEAAREVADEYRQADEDMGGHGGQNAERADACEAFADEVENAAQSLPDFDDEAEDRDEAVQNFWDELQAALDDLGEPEV